jgi:methionyl-tRNA formyltransferase
VARLVFLGTPEAAVPSLEALVAAGHEVRLVVSRPDRRRGRGGQLSPSPVKRAATALGLAVTDRLEDVLGAGAELGVVVAYGRIIPATILAELPMVNVHFSLLPRWRGAAPVERALLAGDPVTGVSIMRLDEGLDTGPVLARVEVPVRPEHTAASLTAELAATGAALLVEVLARGVEGLGPGEPQVGEATLAPKLTPEELVLDWEQPAEHLARVVRLGRAQTRVGDRRLHVLAATPLPAPPGDPPLGPAPRPGTVLGPGRGPLAEALVVQAGGGTALALDQVQPEGRGPMGGAAWWRGARLPAGTRLGEERSGGR